MDRPDKPEMNSDHGNLWDMMAHVNERVDKLHEEMNKLHSTILVSALFIFVSIVGTMAAVLLK